MAHHSNRTAKLQDAGGRERLQQWLDHDLLVRFGERLLDIDRQHNLTLVTRNRRGFSRYPIEVLNPWELQDE